MQTVDLTSDYFAGAISIQQGEGFLKPWRIPYERRALFIAPNDSLVARAEHAGGVRLRCTTDTTTLRLQVKPMAAAGSHEPSRAGAAFDLTIDNELITSYVTPEGAESVIVDTLPTGRKSLEIWLPQDAPVAIRSLEIDDGATCEPAPDERPKWITYGSSLTHCVRAYSPARTWPAIVSRRHNLNLTSLGYGGNCALDPLVGLMIRDQPADYITLKLGINTINGGLNARTFPAAVMGLICIIREKHPTTPMSVVSPIGYPPRETEPNMVGYTIGDMREAIEDVVNRLQAAGDSHLTYVNGLRVFDLDLIAQYTKDECHPDAAGIEVQAENFDREVMRPLLGKA